MGNDATNFLPVGTRRKAVQEALASLGFEEAKGNPYFDFYFSPDTGEYTTGVGASLERLDDGRLSVWTHTQIWRSRSDTDHHNLTIRTLKQRFGGGFSSDNGSNAYLANWRPYRHGAEAALYKAFAEFESAMKRVEFTSTHAVVGETPTAQAMEEFLSPQANLNHLVLVFLAATVEDYFRRSWVGLLRHSNRKAAVLKNARSLTGEDLASVSDGDATIEDLVAQYRGFLTLDRVVAHFREVDPSLDIGAPLHKPYRRRKRSLYDSLRVALERRNEFIHTLRIGLDYGVDQRNADIADAEAAITRVYEHILDHYGWSEYDL